MQSSLVSTIVLAGGKSSRMGRDKALIEIEGVPFLRRVCDVASQCTSAVYVVTPWIERYQSILPDRCQLIQEQPLPNEELPHGPLIGFAQGLAHIQNQQIQTEQIQTEWVLLLACDLPHLSVTTLQQWIQMLDTIATPIALSPKTEKGWDPLCGFYRISCLPHLTAATQQGIRSFQDWLAQEDITELPMGDRAMLFNCNTPAELDKLKDIKK